MSGDEFFISPREVEQLGKSFQSLAYDLEQYARTFQGATEAAGGDLSEQMSEVLDGLCRHLDGMGDQLLAGSRTTEALDEALARPFAGESGQ